MGDWSPPVNFDVVGMGGVLPLRRNGWPESFDITMTVEFAEDQLGKIVTFGARYVMYNHTEHLLVVREPDGGPVLTIPPTTHV